ncbi:MAG: UDP-N-acetylmuramate dehydrogenase [Frankiales bacterium]|nr:UDP-N-acetylmuramate dehydrogenase [Frankiales bacterium]
MNLSELTTLRLGGPVGELITCTTEDQLVEAARSGAYVLGGGSNVVMPDAGLDRVALVRTDGWSQDGEVLSVQAGLGWDEVVRKALDAGLTGFEAMSGIPGTVGAAPIQNIGAYGAEVSSYLTSVRALDLLTGEVTAIGRDECGFGYRSSRFKAEPGRWVVLSVDFALPSEPQPVRYTELATALGVGVGDPAPPVQVREAVLALRRSKGMVLDPADPDSVSAGSFFTNPLVATAPEGAPHWPDPSGLVKVSAAWLIEHSGFGKGWGDGRIGLSRKHTLALVNRGGGTTAELLEVMRTIQEGVHQRFGIALVNEPVIV